MFVVARVFEQRLPEETAALKAAVSDLTGEPVGDESFWALAGPNEVWQLAGTAKDWLDLIETLVLTAHLGKSAAPSIRRFTKDTVRAISATLSPILTALRNARVKGQEPAIAVQHPRLFRNAGMQLETDDPEEVTWIILNFARCADAIYAAAEARTRDRPANHHPGVMDWVRIDVRPDGSVWMNDQQLCGPPE